MLGKFLGRTDPKSALQKNQIEVVCPLCGGAQKEPRLVVTTFCRHCGEHLRIDKQRVIASSQINPVPSTVFPSMPDEVPAPVSHRPAPEPDPDPAYTDHPWPAALLPGGSPPAKDLAPGLGDGMDLRDDDGFVQRPAAPPMEDSAVSAPTSALSRMKEHGSRQHYFKEIECFDCRNKFKVGRSAKSTNCPSCGAYICMEDFDINVASTSPIRTRGDVMIRKTGNVSTSEIRCRDLRVLGNVSATIECTGEFLIRSTGTVIGEVHCNRLIIEKGGDIHFMNTIYASEVEARARLFGNIQCQGPVVITSTGWVHGDVTARSISIEPGGQLDGAMNILQSNTLKKTSAREIASGNALRV